MTSPILLTPIQARILATLIEKARTVPDSYPMTLNSLILGCNQKTSRDPVLQVEEAQALEAIDGLRDLNLVHEALGGRTTRYTHNFQRGIGVPEQSAVLLALLMLRGPQTAGELRLNADRWYRFADISSVQAFLDELQERSDDKGGPLVVPLPRAPGSRETRWMHLLCGPVDTAAFAAGATSGPVDAGAAGGLQARVDMLEKQTAALLAMVRRLHAELGLASPDEGSEEGA